MNEFWSTQLILFICFFIYERFVLKPMVKKWIEDELKRRSRDKS